VVRRDVHRLHRLVSLDASESRSWYERHGDELRRELAGSQAELRWPHVDDSDMARRVVACAGGDHDEQVERLWEAVPKLRPSPGQHDVAAYLNERFASLAIPLLLGHASARGLGRKKYGPILKPFVEASGKKSGYQSANTEIGRVVPRLRASLVLMHLLEESEGEFARSLLEYASDGWREGTVGLLAAEREHLAGRVPAVASNLGAASGRIGLLAFGLLDRALKVEGNLRTDIVDFLKVYQLLRLVALFHPQPADLREAIRGRLNGVVRERTIKRLWLERALKRSLHLLMSREERSAFIDELLDWADEPSGYGATFSAYEASYYLGALDEGAWGLIESPYSHDPAWSMEALSAVVEQCDQNTHELWYDKPHNAAINLLRVVVYLRAHPEPHLTRRERISVSHIANHAGGRVGHIDHARRVEILDWAGGLKRYAREADW
jgi:hypothetical protein